MGTTRMVSAVGRSLLAGVLGGLLPSAAMADNTCNGFINIDYVGAPPVTPIGDTVDMELSFGTGSIQNGTKMTIHSFQVNLDCNANFPLTPPCTDEGEIVGFESIVSTTCPTTWSTTHPVGPNPNLVVIEATPPLDIPANVPTLPGFCTVTLRIRVLGPDIDGSGAIEELTGYGVGHCDNGILLSGGFQTSSITTPPPLHFDCYEVVNGGIPAVSVTLQDRFGTTTAKLTKLKRLCAPTNKNNEDPGAEASPDHLGSYIIDSTVGPFQKPKGIQVSNQFGVMTVNVVAPVFLMTPTAKSITPPPPPPPLPGGLSHYQCYKLDNVKNAPANKDVTLVDQFGSLTVDLDKRGPFRLCVPVNKNGEDPGAPTDPSALVCYTTKNDRLPFSQKSIFIANQFGSLASKVTQYDELCVPSTILP